MPGGIRFRTTRKIIETNLDIRREDFDCDFALQIHTEIWKLNFPITKMLVLIRFSRSFLEALDKKLGNREIEQKFNHDIEREGDEWTYK